MCSIYGITNKGDINVTYPVIWELLDKYKIWDIVKKNTLVKDEYKNIEMVSKWLCEFEKFIVLWKTRYFKGQSIGDSLRQITERIKSNETYSLSRFRKELLGIIINDQDIKIINENFCTAIKEKISNNIEKDMMNKNKINFLVRIDFYLSNRKKLIISPSTSDLITVYNHKKITYEHFLANKPKNEIEKKYQLLSSSIGNGILLTKTDNISAKNKPIWEKYESYEKNNTIPDTNKIYYGEKDILSPLFTNEMKKLYSQKNDKLKHELLNLFEKNIKLREAQIANILYEMYKYEEINENSDDKS
ncbi:GmrSD restriction endonuclease domain-containing protein [Mycoplasma elephantis]|uniref:GmrSD restriction endonuclease domain-containing protein n=1 Tax=Mycoplasma elephantis TaxID=114882 RepID=UPI00048288A1|nr:DUF1524 domain-containing protein [Mycoplasma elephantis]